MSYEYSSDRQVAMVMDLNKCLGCQTCTVACKTLWTRNEGMEGMWWNTVSTMPGEGTPKGVFKTTGGGFKDGKAQPGRLPTQEEFGNAWKFNHKEVLYGGDPDAFLKPDSEPTWGPNFDEDMGEGDHPNNHYFYLPRICNHCTRPACLEACPRGAIEKRKKDGIVVINEDRCRGYQFCAEACPYKKIYYNAVTSKSQKCFFCYPRIEKGVATACSRQCPGRVRFLGYKDDQKSPIYKLVNDWKVALPLHAEFETDPNVFYVPPLAPDLIDEEGNPTGKPRIPAEYLESLFGPKVHAALETIKTERAKVAAGGKSELIDILISRRWLDMFSEFDQHPRSIEQFKQGEAIPVKIMDPSQLTAGISDKSDGGK